LSHHNPNVDGSTMRRTLFLAALVTCLSLFLGLARALADDSSSAGASSYFARWSDDAEQDAPASPSAAAAPTYRSSFEDWSDCRDCYDRRGDRLLGFIAPSDMGMWRFISPMTNIVYFEDPRTLTEIRPIFIQNKIPFRAPLAGGDVQVIAVQMRAALTENLSVIATKDGFIMYGADGPADDGWANVNAGLKYNLYKDYERQQILSGAIVYELPVGSTRALQGNGSGVFDLILSGAAQLDDYWRTVSAFGLRLPSDVVDNSQSLFWSLHFDRTIGNRGLYVLTEFNWFHWLRSGENGIDGIEGLNLYNLGSTGVAGDNVVTGAIGFKFKPNPYREYGIAWQVPLTDRRYLMDNRITVDAIFRY